VNSITVSKKRSWLQQSTHRPPPPPPLGEENTCKETCGAVILVPKSPTLLPELAVPWAPSTSPVGREPPARSCDAVGALPSTVGSPALRSAALDCGEDSDADDEGEIWYNPIPEDEEPDLLRACPAAVGCPAARYKHPPGGDTETATGPHEGPPCSVESVGDGQMAQPCEAGQADGVHPGEHAQQHWQRFACKALSVPTAEDNPAFKCPATGKRVQEHRVTELFMLEKTSPEPPFPSG